MVKIVDIDELFDKYIAGYVYSNVGKVKPEEIENNIPVLYKKFGDEPLKELNGKTPNEYYTAFSTDELLNALKTHIEKGVAVSDFLCEAIERGEEKVIVNRLDEENGEEFTAYLLNFIDVKNINSASDKLLEFVLFDYPAAITELAAEILCKEPEAVKERVISAFSDAAEEKKDCLAEILSKCTKDDRIFDILIGRFLSTKKIALYAGYLGRYGDERAIPYLAAAAEDEKTDYADFEELRFAIELLGGEYKGKRNFSSDKTLKKIQGARNTAIVGKK